MTLAPRSNFPPAAPPPNWHAHLTNRPALVTLIETLLQKSPLQRKRVEDFLAGAEAALTGTAPRLSQAAYSHTFIATGSLPTG